MACLVQLIVCAVKIFGRCVLMFTFITLEIILVIMCWLLVAEMGQERFDFKTVIRMPYFTWNIWDTLLVVKTLKWWICVNAMAI
jgi:hypothetical protein